jgi:hypothetical protein
MRNCINAVIFSLLLLIALFQTGDSDDLVFQDGWSIGNKTFAFFTSNGTSTWIAPTAALASAAINAGFALMDDNKDDDDEEMPTSLAELNCCACLESSQARNADLEHALNCLNLCGAYVLPEAFSTNVMDLIYDSFTSWYNTGSYRDVISYRDPLEGIRGLRSEFALPNMYPFNIDDVVFN